jgi:uncharacterized protein YfbU (UPF0304 family)
MQKLILNNSTYEEEKSVIHKLNQVISMFFLYTRRNQIWIILIKLYHLQKTKIAKVVINQMQIDTHKHKTKY